MTDPRMTAGQPSVSAVNTHQFSSMPGAGAPAHLGGQAIAVASGRLFKSRNPILTWLVWPVLTLGIYSLVWYYKIHKEMAEFDRRRQLPVAGPVLVLILLGWTIIAPLVSYYNTAQRIQNAQRTAGLPGTCSPVVALILVFVVGLHPLYMQSELNKIVDHYGAAPEGTVVPLFV